MFRLPLLRARGLRRADRSFRDVNGTPTSEEPTFRDVGVPCHVVQSYSSRTVRSLDIPGLGIRLVVWRPRLHYAQTRVLAGLEAALNVDVPLSAYVQQCVLEIIVRRGLLVVIFWKEK